MAITIKTAVGDMQAVNTGSYPATAVLGGAFTGADDYEISGGCADPDLGLTREQLMTPCVRLRFDVNAVMLNDSGSRDIATVSIPCWNSPLGYLTSPCLPAGKYLSDGTFVAIDQTRSSCDLAACAPYHTVTLSADFEGSGQTLVLRNDAIVAMSRRTEEDFGYVDLAYMLANQWRSPTWVSFNAGSEAYRAIPKGLRKNGSDESFGFELEQAPWVPAKRGVSLISIGGAQTERTATMHYQLASDAGMTARMRLMS
ncbi:MAG: hypothetical protein ABI612_00980 [Betaproteobacteria bacterium]